MKIGIIGQGFVGNAVFQTFKNFYDVFTYDIKDELSNSSLDKIKRTCEIVFICVPTLMNSDGSCNSTIVESVIKNFSDTKNNVLKSVLKTNNKFRRNRDWEKMKGRAIN